MNAAPWLLLAVLMLCACAYSLGLALPVVLILGSGINRRAVAYR